MKPCPVTLNHKGLVQVWWFLGDFAGEAWGMASEKLQMSLGFPKHCSGRLGAEITPHLPTLDTAIQCHCAGGTLQFSYKEMGSG